MRDKLFRLIICYLCIVVIMLQHGFNFIGLVTDSSIQEY